jgi:hypothetical protein
MSTSSRSIFGSMDSLKRGGKPRSVAPSDSAAIVDNSVLIPVQQSAFDKGYVTRIADHNVIEDEIR